VKFSVAIFRERSKIETRILVKEKGNEKSRSKSKLARNGGRDNGRNDRMAAAEFKGDVSRDRRGIGSSIIGVASPYVSGFGN
jgi:hypothetical protein